MSLLLLGCTGFVGKELVPALLKEGHDINIISRQNVRKLKLGLDIDKFQFLRIDLSIKESWENETLLNTLRETEGIINLIGEPIADKKWTSAQKE